MFGLGEDVAVNLLVGLPTLRQWGSVFDFGENIFVACSINTYLPLIYEPTKKGLPVNVSFNVADFN